MTLDEIDRGAVENETDSMRAAREVLVAASPPPQFIKLRAELLAEGRSDDVLADTGAMKVRLKVYASGGENGLHNHSDEDHMHLVLSGTACFFGPRGEEKHLGPYEGIVLPAGCFYRFQTTSQEPLVLLRVGCKVPSALPHRRYNVYGEPLPSESRANGAKRPPVGTGKFWGAPY
jgi:mannose-6-phosphate isomerase-like protein (cupin superfamily)